MDKAWIKLDALVVCREYYYVGRSRQGNQPLSLTDIHVEGTYSKYTFVNIRLGATDKTGFLTIRVSLNVPPRHNGF